MQKLVGQIFIFKLVLIYLKENPQKIHELCDESDKIEWNTKFIKSLHSDSEKEKNVLR